MPLLGGALEAQLFGLPVEGDEIRGDVGEHGDRHGPSAGRRPGAALECDGAGDDRFVVGAAAGFLDAFAHGFGNSGEDALDFGLLCAFAHDSRADLAAHEEGQGGDEHGLARTGLTGDDGEAGVEFDGGLGDDAEVGDAQFGDHSGLLDRSSPAGDGQAELCDESVGERAGVQASEADR